MVITFSILIQFIIYAIIIGILLTVGGLYYKRKFFEGKILCHFYTRQRTIVTQLLRPNEDNMIAFNNGLYLIRRPFVRIGKSLLGEEVPTLTFVEDNPHPIEVIEEYAPDLGDITSRQLASDFDDMIAREIARYTNEEGIEQIKDPAPLILIAAGAILLSVGFTVWFINGKISEIVIG